VPGLEQLEDRTVPAGIVNVTSFTGGVLTLTAVDNLTDVNVTNANHQNITIDGASTNNIKVIANDGENGKANGEVLFSFNNVISIKLVMGLGNDTVTITDTNLTGTLTFQGGSGNNTLNIDGAGDFSGKAATLGANNVALRNLTVTNGDGFDTLAIGGGDHTITGTVTINNGVGGGDTLIGMTGGDQTTFNGAISLTNLAGDDNFETGGDTNTFNGGVTIRNGTGNTTTSFNAATADGLNGGLTIINTAGEDDFLTTGGSFTVGTALARRNLTITNGNGASLENGGGSDTEFTADSNFIFGNISISALAGDDTFIVAGLSFDSGNISLRYGNGDSDVEIGDFFDNTVTNITGNISIVNGEGFDAFETSGASFTLGVDPPSSGRRTLTISNGNGDSEVLFGAASDTINGSVSVSNRDGFDLFEVSSTATFAVTGTGSVTINNGIGGSETAFQEPVADAYIIGGKLTLTGSDGVDEVNILGLDVLGATSFTTGEGNDVINIDNATFGAFKVTAGGGADQVLIENSAANPGDSNFTGAANINMGNGDDILSFGFDAANGANFTSGVTLAGGLDLDRLIGLSTGFNTGLPAPGPLPFLGFEQLS